MFRKIINKNDDRYAFYGVVDLNRVERAKEPYFEYQEMFEIPKKKNVKLSANLIAKLIENAKDIILNSSR